MENQLFRKKSLESISSPEEMHDYMRVTTPRLWMLLTAIVVLVAGFIVYASMTTLENTIPIKVNVDNYEVENGEGKEPTLYSSVSAELPASERNNVDNGMVVRIGNETGKITYIGAVAEEDKIYIIITMDHSYIGGPSGEREAELVLESTTPISFLWNK